MEKLLKGYVFRMYPTLQQQILIEESFGVSRYIYNYFLDKYHGKKFYQIDTYYPSSQICNRCGYQERKVKDLSIRNWECPSCSNVNERAINASINIMWEGIKLYMKEVQELQSF